MLNLAAGDIIAGVAATATAITMTMTGMQLAAGVEAYKVLYQGQLATSVGTLYTTPASTQTFVKSIHLANATASDVSGIKLYEMGSVAANQITGSLTIPANGWATYEEDGWRVYNALGECLHKISNLSAGGTTYPGLSTITRLAYKRSTTTTNADPGANFFRISNTDVGSNADAFSLYISDTDNNGVSKKAFLNQVAASDLKLNSIVSISTGATDSSGILARVAAITINSGYTKLDCICLSAAFNDPANNAVCELAFWTEAGTFNIPNGDYSTSALAGIPGFTITHQTTEAMPSGVAQMLLYPFSTRVPIRIRKFHWNLGTAGSGTMTGRLGVYRAGLNNASMPRLGANMFTLAALTTMFQTTGAQSQAANQNLPPGHYWLALAIGALGGSPVMKSCYGHYNESNNLYLSDDSTQNTAFQWATRWSITGTFTTTFAAEGTAIGNVTYTFLAATNAPITPFPIIMAMSAIQ